jgi:hypothetical protein
MSFMAVAYIPAFLEDRQLFIKERANGLYGPTSFMVANFIIGLPYLCEYYRDALLCILLIFLGISNFASTKFADHHSPYCNHLLRCHLLALQLPT